MNILKIEDLCKDYDNFKLNHVSFSVPQGTIMGFIGENGAGKTTTIKLILNLVNKDSGRISVFGKDNIKEELNIKEQIGVVSDEGFFSDHLFVNKIDGILKNIYKNWDSVCFQNHLKRFELPLDKKIKEYSKGMKVKLTIATALSHHPKLLILDEATSGLDPIVRNEILDIFLDFIQDEEHAILFSSHITSDLEKIADYITFIHKGNIVFSSSKDELLENFGILKCGTSDFSKISKEDIIGFKKSSFGYEILVSNRKTAKRKYPDFVIDQTSLEEIMLYYVKGDQE